MKINNNDNIILEEGFNYFEIDNSDDLSFKIEANKNTNCFIKIINGNKINIEGKIKSDNTTIVFWNDSNSNIETIENYDVLENANFNVAYGECNNNDTNRKVDVNLKGINAKALLSSASLVSTNKNYNIKVTNEVKHTIGHIRNFAVVLEKGKLMIDAIGKINKGAIRSESHQVSRGLSFEQGQNTTILPELLIDENDVAASHAMSIGRVDENQLYYLMSRGLDDKQCLSLISKGYLLPIVDLIENAEIKEKLSNELERKIEEICLM